MTPYKRLITVTTIVSLMGMAHADVTLKVDDNIKVTAINGQEIKQSTFQPLKKVFKLEPGKHVITAKYDRLYDLRKDEHDYLRSGNVTVTAQMLEDNQTYRLTMPGQPERYEDAKDFVKSPTLAVQKGNQVLAKTKGATSGGGLLSGLTGAIGGMLGAGDAQRVNQEAIAAIDSPSASPKVSQVDSVPVMSSQPIASESSHGSTLDRFMQLWLQATPAEREKIRGWVQE